MFVCCLCFEGGKYRHPHIAFSAVETYLAHEVMPLKCGTKWDDSNYPPVVDTTVAFPKMEGGFPNVDDLEAPTQPTIEDDMFIWPGPGGTKKKPVKGHFATHLHIVPGSTPIDTSVGRNGPARNLKTEEGSYSLSLAAGGIILAAGGLVLAA